MNRPADNRSRLLDGALVGDLLVQALDRYHDRAAFIDGEARMSYSMLADKIAHARARFAELGLQPGDTVAQLAGNRADVYAVMAAAYIGGLRSLTLHAMGGLEDHAFILADAEASLLVADAAHEDRAILLRDRIGERAAVVLHDDGGRLPWFWQPTTSIAPIDVMGAPEDIIRLAYTGGTTGQPKGVMLSNRALVTNTLLALAGIDWPDDIRFLCPAPISHGAGSIILPTLMRGGTVILQQGFAVEAFLAKLRAHRATVTWLVPTMIYALLDHPATQTADLSSLATLIYSGAPMAPARIRDALNLFGPVLVQCYGQTEAPNTILRLSRADHAAADDRRLASAGRPFPGLKVTVRDADDVEVARGVTGEICVRGPLVMSGYWKRPEATAEALRGDWLRTGDLGFVDDGYFHIVDRQKDMIISGGFNVYPKEIEDILLTHPAVSAAAVIGVPDPKWGEAVKALVMLKPGAAVDADDLAQLVRQAKGPVHTPKSIDYVAAIPLTVLGKPDKKAIRRRFWNDKARQVG